MATHRILLADADAVARTAVAAGLRDAGHEVLETGDGEQALRIAADAQPAAAVVDLQLSGAGVREVTTRLRAAGDVAVVAVTAVDDAGLAAEAVSAGALGYLCKPLDPRELLVSIELAIARAAEIRDLNTSCSQLTRALEQGRETSVAIGILMARERLGERAAFDLLRGYARRNRRKLADVAAELVSGAGALNALCGEIAASPER